MSCDLEVTKESARCWEKISSYITVGHFWVWKTLTLKMRSSAQPFLWKWVSYLLENKKSFPYQRMSTQPCFDTEARGNFEVVYYTYIFNMVKNCWTVMTQGFERTLTRWIDLRITMHDQSSLSFNALFLASQSTVGDWDSETIQ